MNWLTTLAQAHAPGLESPLGALRQQALAVVAARGVPTPREEAWKYTDLRPLGELALVDAPAAIQIEDTLAPLLESTPHRLVFVDGVLSPTLSALDDLPPSVQVRPLREVLAHDPESLRATLTRYAAQDAQVFAALNAGCARDGAVIELAAASRLEAPLLVAFLNSPNPARCFTAPLIVVNADAHSQLTLIELHYGQPGAQNLSAALTDISAGAGSQLAHYRLQIEAAEALHLGHLRLALGEQAQVDSHSFAFGAKLARLDINAELAAPGAAVTLNGLFHAQAGQHIDHQTKIDHAAPHTTSNELYKGLASGDGRGVFRGQVLVRPNAQKIAAKQASHNLLLSPNAEIDTKPELEIYADDVSCAHGATVGQLDESALFYLRSRGIPLAEARALLVFGFTQDVVEQVNFAPLREWLANTLAGSADVPLPEKIEVSE